MNLLFDFGLQKLPELFDTDDCVYRQSAKHKKFIFSLKILFLFYHLAIKLSKRVKDGFHVPKGLIFFFATAQKLTESVTEAHLKLHVPSINGKFLAMSWFAGGFIFVDINLKQSERPQNNVLLLHVNFFCFVFPKELEKIPE